MTEQERAEQQNIGRMIGDVADVLAIVLIVIVMSHIADWFHWSAETLVSITALCGYAYMRWQK